MSSVVKVIIAWFIALAIPLQGVAAVAFPLCPPDHHPAVAVAPAGPSHHHVGSDHRTSHDGGSHQGDPHHADSHHGTSAGADLLPTPAQVADAAATGGDGTATGHHVLNCCSATCATCAIVAMPLAGIGVRAPARSQGPLAAAEPIDLGVTPDGLDRPPKYRLA